MELELDGTAKSLYRESMCTYVGGDYRPTEGRYIYSNISDPRQLISREQTSDNGFLSKDRIEAYPPPACGDWHDHDIVRQYKPTSGCSVWY